MTNITVLGFVASFCVVAAFIPQAFQIFKTKDTHSISLPMYIIMVAGTLLWVVYGFLIWDLPVMITNLFIFVLAAAILGMKIKNG